MLASFRNSIYSRLLFLFLVTLVPIISTSLILNNVTTRELYQSRTDNIRLQINTNMDLLEKEIQRINRSQQLFLLRESLPTGFSDDYPSMSSYVLGQTVREMYASIQELSLNSDIIENVELHFPKINRSVSIENYYSDSLDQSYQVFFKSLDQVTYGKMSYFDDQLQMQMGASRYSAETKQRSLHYILNVQLSNFQILNMLKSIDTEAGAALIGNDWYIAEDNDRHLVADLLHLKVNERNPSPANQLTATIDGTKHIVIYRYSPVLDAVLISYLAESTITNKLAFYQRLTYLLLLVSAIAAAGTAFSLHRMIRRPLGKLIQAFQIVERGKFLVSMPHKRKDEFGVLHLKFNQMVDRLNVLIQETYIQNLELNKARFKQLQAQIAPHFLYNSFNILRHAVQADDKEVAVELSNRLGKYFQSITHNELDEIELSEEYGHAINYIEIQRIRFRSRIRVRIKDLPDKYKDLMVPRLIVHPLVENSYKHGIHHMEHGARILLSAFETDGHLCILVADNGKGLPQDELRRLREGLAAGHYGQHTGLVNVYQRMKLMFGDKGHLSVESREGRYFAVRLLIPVNDYKQEKDEG